MAAITVPLGPQSKTSRYRASVIVTAYPGSAQFTNTAFQAKGMKFFIESSTRTADFSADGTNTFLTLNGVYYVTDSYDDFHLGSVWVKVDDAAGATIQIVAWA